MAQIQSLSIANLFGRPGTTRATFSEGINVLYGRNGKGKTTVLNFIASAFSDDIKYIEAVQFKQARVRISVPEYGRDMTKSVARSVLYESTLGSREFYDRFPDERSDFLASDFEEIIDKKSFVWENLNSSEASLPIDISYLQIDRLHKFKSLNEERADGENFATYIRNLWTMYNSQLSSQVELRQENVLVDLILKNGSREETRELVGYEKYDKLMRFISDRPRFSAKFQITPDDFYIRYSEDATFRRIVDELIAMQEFSESVHSPKNVLFNILQELFSEEIKIRFFNNNIHFYAPNGKRIYLDRLSSGEKQVLLILISVANAGKNTILIDEPELSMHVSWQKRLVKYIKMLNPSAQVIMATHSPEIVSSDSEIRFIKI